MVQTNFLRKVRSWTATLVGVLFLFTTVATPLVEANFWEQRRDATRRMNGKDQPSGTLLARLPGSLGTMDGVLPAVNGALGGAFQTAPASDLTGVSTPADLRASALPSWLRGLPNSAGEIRDVALAKDAENAPVVVLVQDVHNIFSAQKNIAQIVSHIETAAERDNRGPVLVGLEGGVGAFDIKRFRALRSQKGHRLASELLLKTNIISGPEYYAFLSEKEPLLWGIETRADYIENAEAVRASHPATERVTAALASAQRAVDAKGDAVFSKELKDLNQTLAAHAQGSATIVDLVRVLRERAPKAPAPEVDKLQKALDTESKLDFAQVERERTALIEILVRVLDAGSIERLVNASLSYRANQISFGAYHAQLKSLVKQNGIRWSDYNAFDSYIHYVLLAESIDKFRLFDELEQLKAKAVAAAGRTVEERTIMGLAEDLRLIARLVRHEFGPAEWKAYSAHKEDLSRLPARLADALGLPSVSGPSKEDVALFERFYVAADRRNESLASNLLAKAQETNAKVMMLVAGGFHTPELENILKARGLSVVTVTPTLGEIPKGSNYLDIFVVKNIPLEQFLQGEKLYFSPPRVYAGERPLLEDSPVKQTSGDGIYSAALSAVNALKGEASPENQDAVGKQFPNTEIEQSNADNLVTVVATAESGESFTTVEAWEGDYAGDPSHTGVVVSEERTSVACMTGATPAPKGGSWRLRFGALNKPSIFIGTLRGFLLRNMSGRALGISATRSIAMAKRLSIPTSRMVKLEFQSAWNFFAKTRYFLAGFRGERTALEILEEWFYSGFPFIMRVVPEEKIFSSASDLDRGGMSEENFEKLKRELLEPETLYFDLSVLALTYNVSVEFLSSLLRGLGQKKILQGVSGGWISFLTIDRPDAELGQGPFVARFQEVHEQGYLHDTVVVLAVTPDGRTVLQHRVDKNQYDVGASGHVDVGESPLMAASRELKEDLGIDSAVDRLMKRLVHIPNPARPNGTFSKLGGRGYSSFAYRGAFDFSGPSNEQNNRESVHLYAILLTPDEVTQIENTSHGVTAAHQEVNGVQFVDPSEITTLVGDDGKGFANSLRHFFQGEEIRGVVSGYLRGFLTAKEFGQDYRRVALTERRMRQKVYGMALIAGRPFPENGILRDVITSLRNGLEVASNGRISNFGDIAYTTLAPVIRSKPSQVATDDLAGIDLSGVLAALAETGPMTFELEAVGFGDLHDGSVILTLREIGDGRLEGLRVRLRDAGLPFKYAPDQTGNRLYVHLATIGTKSFAAMTEADISSVRLWMERHKDLQKWWDLHRRYLKEKLKNNPGFSDENWLSIQLGHSVDENFIAVWQEESRQLSGKPLSDAQEVLSHVLLGTYNNRRFSGLISQGITLPLGKRSPDFPDPIALVEQVAAVQLGLDYHAGRLKTDPVGQEFRPSRKEDVPYLQDLSSEERSRLAKLGLAHVSKGTLVILAAGAASRMANDFPAEALALLKTLWNSDNPPYPKSKAAVPIAKVEGQVITFLGAFLKNVKVFLKKLRRLGFTKFPSVLIYSNGQYINELETELSNHDNYELDRSQIDTALQKLRPQFGGSVADVMRMKLDGKFKSEEAFLVALAKARDLENKLARGQGEAALLVEEKAPHGHGEFLHDFVASGKLLRMIEDGKDWIFVRNVDNVGATVDLNFLISLGSFFDRSLDFQGEVSPRIKGMKGGALIVTKEGQTVLTEGPSFGATWIEVEKDLDSRGFAVLTEEKATDYVRDTFESETELELIPTRMDFEGGSLKGEDEALQAVKDGDVRVYSNSSGETIAVRHVVPESTYWFNDATGLFSPKYFYFLYRRDENQTYDEFVEEMRGSYSRNHGGLQAIAQRGKVRFPMLLDAKPTKSGGVGQKPETNAWQSTQVAAAAGAKIGAFGVDSLLTADDSLASLRFLATKQWEGPIESFSANSPLYPKVITPSLDGDRLIPAELNDSTQNAAHKVAGSQPGSTTNKQRGRVVPGVALKMAVGLIVLLFISPLVLAAPELAANNDGLSLLSFSLTVIGLFGLWSVRLNRSPRVFRLSIIALVSGVAVVIPSSIALVGFLSTVAVISIGVTIWKRSNATKNLFQASGTKPLAEPLIPAVRYQLNDLEETTRKLTELYSGVTVDGGESVGIVESRREELLRNSDVMGEGARNLVNAVGGNVPASEREFFPDHVVRVAVLLGLVKGLHDMLELAESMGFVKVNDNYESPIIPAIPQVVGTFKSFAKVLLGYRKSKNIQERMNRIIAWAKGKIYDLRVIDQIARGVPQIIYLDESADGDKIQNMIDRLRRYMSPAGIEAFKTPGTELFVIVTSGLENGSNGELIQRLLELQEKLGDLPIQIVRPDEFSGLVTSSDAGMVVQLAEVLRNLKNIKVSDVELIQCIAAPTSTVVFNSEGLDENVVVERILWLLAGIGLRIDNAETEIRSLVAALKAA
jgi:ADP-ribose pyrophosphatase YjhB (NUDIX family)